MAKQTITTGTVVTMHYTLKDDDDNLLDSSSDGAPLTYLQGAQNIVPGLESALTGKSAGDKINTKVAAEQGYGAHNGHEPELVPKSAFGKDAKNLRVGMPIRAQASDGTPMTLWITEDRGSRVAVDSNHPLAGKTLHFAVEILSLREASAEERSHGHVHGPGGHHH
jgi:FKBP-type peptidyl-prolyl cis-trans isomerase SlyD